MYVPKSYRAILVRAILWLDLLIETSIVYYVPKATSLGFQPRVFFFKLTNAFV